MSCDCVNHPYGRVQYVHVYFLRGGGVFIVMKLPFHYRKTPGGQDFTENIKHKVWLRVGLDCLEIVKSKCTLCT